MKLSPPAPVLSCLLLALATLSSACEIFYALTDNCDERGCSHNAEISAEFWFPIETVSEGKVTVCRNKTCFGGRFVTGADPLRKTATFSPGAPSSGPIVSALVERTQAGGTKLITRWMVYGDGDLRAGDVYKITLSDPHGATLTTFTETVKSYGRVYPGGPDCHRPGCKQVSIHRPLP